MFSEGVDLFDRASNTSKVFLYVGDIVWAGNDVLSWHQPHQQARATETVRSCCSSWLTWGQLTAGGGQVVSALVYPLSSSQRHRLSLRFLQKAWTCFVLWFSIGPASAAPSFSDFICLVKLFLNFISVSRLTENYSSRAKSRMGLRSRLLSLSS